MIALKRKSSNAGMLVITLFEKIISFKLNSNAMKKLSTRVFRNTEFISIIERWL
jgi:hypothetical protein